MTMSSTIRHLDDSDSGTATLLTLPLSDFSKHSQNNNADDRESDDLILVSLSNSESDGGVTMNDLMNGQNSVYILGDTAESDIAHSSNVPTKNIQQHQEDEGHANQYSSSFEPVAARLIVEPTSGVTCVNQAKTLDLVRVETSNTYIVTPPMAVNSDDNNVDEQESKRQKLSSGGTQKMVSMPARSIGKVPGEDTPSCFFLDPTVLPKGHFANKLRNLLSRWVYNPLEPPSLLGGEESSGALFGYNARELAHICRSSLAEIEYALSNRAQGAEDALVIPYNANEKIEPRYGVLSEEGRQTLSMAIVSTLLESDLDLHWSSSDEAMALLPLVKEVRSNWQREEGAGTKLADEIIWHGLRPIASYTSMGSKNDMPKQVKLIEDEVAKMAAHHVFLRGNPQSMSGWEEDEFMEAWAMRLPTMTKSYQPNMKLLAGIAISDTAENKCYWRYFPASGLPFNPSHRIKSMLSFRKVWTLEEAKPYFETLSLNESEIEALLKRQKK